MKQIVTPLLEWYDTNKRDLPWRKDTDPYHIWISEIMLQQTRIEAVISYYQKFIKEVPNILSLSQISDERLLKLWEGLGYYTRARNLKKAAHIIIEKYQGNFPNTYKELLLLPGIGEYTASAIGSISFSLKEATVDGNVLRVYMRIHNCFDNIDELKTRKQVRNNLNTIIPDRSGDFNQALMELGEVICLPNAEPKCNRCPISKYCKAYQNNTYKSIPVRNEKKQKKEEKYTILLFSYQNKIAIEKRKEGLLSHLFQFPNIEGHLSLTELKKHLQDQKIKYHHIQKEISYTHIFTHRKWNMVAYYIELTEEQDFHFVSLEELEKKYPLPTAFQPFRKIVKERFYETK